jgi:hypothetical protein
MSTSDDPDKLLTEWLGELETLIGVSIYISHFAADDAWELFLSVFLFLPSLVCDWNF